MGTTTTAPIHPATVDRAVTFADLADPVVYRAPAADLTPAR